MKKNKKGAKSTKNNKKDKKSAGSKNKKTKQKNSKQTLVGKDERNVISFILKDHDRLRESIEVLKDLENESGEQEAKRFIKNLELHAKTEEEAFYQKVANYDDVHAEILEAFVEHSIADSLAKELKMALETEEWSEELAAKAKVLAEIVEHHAEEEEKELLPEVKKILSEEELVQMCDDYLTKRREVKENLELEDSQMTIDEAEEYQPEKQL